MSIEPLSIAAIATALGPKACHFDVDVIDECDSTNSRLLARAANSPSGAVLVAERQTAGRGRLGRSWYAEPGSSLTFSLLHKLPPGRMATGLSLAVGVGVLEGLRQLDIDGLALKWPNDILRDGRKLGGVLIELTGTAAVIGIGLNLRLPSDLPDDVRAMAAALDAPLDRNRLLASLLTGLHEVLDGFGRQGFAGVRERWLRLNAYAERSVRVMSEFATPIEGRCLGVDDDGALLLETTTGVQRVLSGDVSLRLA